VRTPTHTEAARGGAFPQALLFDMDGLLVDTEPMWFAAESALMAELGGELTAEHAPSLVGGPLEHTLAFLRELAGVDTPLVELEQRLLSRLIEAMRAGVRLRPGAKELLAEVGEAGLPCALVSASYRRIVDTVLASVGSHHFAVTLAGDEVARTKPDPEPYLTAARLLGVRPERCVVLEDSPPGVASGQASGAFVVAVPSVAPIPPAAGRLVRSSLEGLDLATLRALDPTRGQAV
jgi:HAD superfamily hydrolase (TIGR01509 family)